MSHDLPASHDPEFAALHETLAQLRSWLTETSESVVLRDLDLTHERSLRSSELAAMDRRIAELERELGAALRLAEICARVLVGALPEQFADATNWCDAA